MLNLQQLAGQAKWVSYQQPSERIDARRALSIFAAGIEIPANAQVVSATLTATALGVYRGFLNGSRVTDSELLPGFTEYNHRLQVHSFDVAPLLQPGNNDLWFELSDGWYRGQIGVMRATDQWGSQTAIAAVLTVELAGGQQLTFATDDSWRYRHSSHLADMCEGEVVDFNRDVPGVLEPVASDAEQLEADLWLPVAVVTPKHGEFVGPISPDVRVIESLAPVNITDFGSGKIVDFGQNIAGWVRLSNLGPAGTKLRLVHGESLDSTGAVTQENFKPNVPFLPHSVTAGQIDLVTSAGVPGQVFEPAHSTKGFRYLFIDGWPADLPFTAADVTAQVVHTDLEAVGSFESSSEDLNWLHRATHWSMRGNVIDIPTDCPTRERAGWAADWEIFFQSGAFLYNVNEFTLKWLRDLVVKQWESGVMPNMAPQPDSEGEGSPIGHLNGSAGWGDSIVLIPWKHYQQYGNVAVLEEFWPNMVRWMDYVTKQAQTGRHSSRVERNAQPLPHERYIWDAGFHFGEWLEPDPSGKPLDFGALVKSDQGIVATAYFAYSTALMARIGVLLGRADEAWKYADLSQKVRDAWNTEFVNNAGRLTVATQANCVRALKFSLLKPQHQKTVEAQLIELVHEAGDHLGTGFLATPYLLPTLADIGAGDLAYKVLTQHTWPSWMGMKDQGATTVWERWEGYDSEGNPKESHNHYSKGAVISFMHQYLAGIRPIEGHTMGERVTIQPVPLGDLTHVNAHHIVSNGRELAVGWTRKGGEFTLNLTVPEGCAADVILPTGERSVATTGTHTFNCELP